jgi:plastocyanin
MIAKLVALLHLSFTLGVALLLTGWIFFLGFLMAVNLAPTIHPATGQAPSISSALPTAMPSATADGGARRAPEIVTMSAQDASQGTAFSFTPTTLTVHAGSTIIWKNTSTAPHTVIGFGSDSGLIMAGTTFTYTFTHVGTFAYVCTLHPGMSGAITVIP